MTNLDELKRWGRLFIVFWILNGVPLEAGFARSHQILSTVKAPTEQLFSSTPKQQGVCLYERVSNIRNLSTGHSTFLTFPVSLFFRPAQTHQTLKRLNPQPKGTQTPYNYRLHRRIPSPDNSDPDAHSWVVDQMV